MDKVSAFRGAHRRLNGPHSGPYWIATLVALITAASASAADVQPLLRAHAHNDYEHERPLLDALDHGFCGIEADVFLVDDKLLVAHERRNLRPDRTLESLYLDPLAARTKQNGGRVYRDGPPITLLIDFKTDAGPTYKALRKTLEKYRDMLSVIEDGRFREGAVQIVISGNRPSLDELLVEGTYYAGYDGRLSDLDSQVPTHSMPLISDSWLSHFRWRGKGPMPEAEQQKLKDAVERAHKAGRKIRFWAIPDNPAMWQAMHDAGVDLINTDNLDGLQKFFMNAETK